MPLANSASMSAPASTTARLTNVISRPQQSAVLGRPVRRFCFLHKGIEDMIYKVRYTNRLLEIARREGITTAELAEAIRAIQEAAGDPTKPLHRNVKQEPVTCTQSLWYRFRPSKAAHYRVVYSLQRSTGHLTVEGVFRRDGRTYGRIAQLFNETPDHTA